jgi:hypothetical protein
VGDEEERGKTERKERNVTNGGLCYGERLTDEGNADRERTQIR